MTGISLNLPEDLSNSLADLAKANGQSVSYLVLAPLSKRKAFEGVVLGDGGWSVEWPALDIQIGADTLLLDALAQNSPDENTRVFIRWRLRHRRRSTRRPRR